MSIGSVGGGDELVTRSMIVRKLYSEGTGSSAYETYVFDHFIASKELFFMP